MIMMTMETSGSERECLVIVVMTVSMKTSEVKEDGIFLTEEIWKGGGL